MNLDIVSKHRGPIYGLSILWIVVFHADAINNVDYSFGTSALVPLKVILGTGNVGVDMFLFLSGICLYFSFTRNNDIMAFLGKRFARVVPAVWLVDGIYWFVYFGLIKGDWVGFVSRMTLARFWMTGDSTIWFVSLILVMYLVFPLVYLYLFDKKAKGRGLPRLIILLAFVYLLILLMWKLNRESYALTEIATTRIPVFILGVWVGQFVYEKREVPAGFAVLALVASVAFIVVIGMGVLHGPFKRFFYLVGGVSLSYSIALICCLFDRLPKEKRPLYRFLSWVGGFSLELYITHIALNQILRLQPFYIEGNLAQYAAVAVAAFFLAWAVMKVISQGKSLVVKKKAS